KFSAIAKFPKVDRDLSLLVPEQVLADKVIATVQKLGKPLVESVGIVDVYVGEKIPGGTRSLSLSLLFGDASRTLEDAEVESAIQKILTGLDREMGVKLRLQ
ncbi:MAG: phenylalanine--tRNA ligase subunit beta, partial [Bdellovibrionota bacterium]